LRCFVHPFLRGLSYHVFDDRSVGCVAGVAFVVGEQGAEVWRRGGLWVGSLQRSAEVCGRRTAKTRSALGSRRRHESSCNPMCSEPFVVRGASIIK
jgi:hypothetical protein